MLSLIKNELYKIFHKKSTLIVLIITILYAILVNVIYNSDAIETVYYTTSTYYDEDAINHYEDFIKNFNPQKDSYEDLVIFESELDAMHLAQKFDNRAWQQEIIASEYFDVAHNYYRVKHNLVTANADKIITEYEEMNKAMREDDWKYLVNKRLERAKVNYSNLLQTPPTEQAKEREKIDYKAGIFAAKANIETLEYRLKENVSFDRSYLDKAINEVNNNSYEAALYDLLEDSKEKASHEQSVKTYYESKYILDEKVDTNNVKSARAVFISFFDEYFFLNLVFIIMIAGGIVSEEFNKGTIKSLLITPHKRTKILLAKFISSLLMIPLFIIFTLIIQFIIGTIFFGTSSLKIPVVIYNLSTKSLEIVGLLKYILLMLITYLPKIILLMTLAFAVSTIFCNTAFAIAITFCGNVAAEIINMFAQTRNLKFLNYFVTTNWDFKTYLFGGSSVYGNSLTHAIIVCLVYFAIMIIVSFIVFKKKDIKNI